MAVFNVQAFDHHEQIVFCHDQTSNLKAIIAIHNTTLGSAVGGCRMWPYASDDLALTDVLRLSRGMTYKNIMAGLPYGGGKSVIIGCAKTDKSPALFQAFGRFVASLSGRYVTAEDVGTTLKDMNEIRKETSYVVGLEGKSGDPSPITAYGTYLGIKAAVKHKLGRDDLQDLRISVQGVGHVGYYLCKLLHDAGAKLIVSDINQEAIAQVVKEFSATTVDVDAIYQQDVDVYAPCALGATLNDKTISQLKTTIVAGAANNQLAEDRHGLELVKRGILYAPDYIINAGGMINVSLEENYNREQAMKKTEIVYDSLMQVFSAAQKNGKATNEVADELARAKLAAYSK